MLGECTTTRIVTTARSGSACSARPCCSTATEPSHSDGAGRPSSLAALLGAIGRPVSVDDLVAAVWDDDAPRTAPTMVHGAVRRIRTTVEPGRGSGPGRFVAVRHGLYVLEPATVWLDAAEFERRVDDGRSLADASPAAAVRILTGALDLWRGPAYAGIERAFARTEAQRLDELRLRCVELLADVHLTLGEHTTAAALLEPLVAARPTRERAASRLMLALYRDDRPADALAVFRRVRHVLVDELGIEPGPVLREVETAVHLRSEVLGWTGARVSDRLPTPLGSFVGREEDVERVGDLVRGHRLVTVTGPGGAGKTRLAIEVVRRDPRRIVFVDLSIAGPGTSVEDTVCEAVGVRSAGPRPAATVAAALAAHPTLVVLDNCEHVLGSCATFVRALVAAGEGSRVLATCRGHLEVPGEQVHRVAPLPVPGPDTPPHELDRYPSLRLFADRAAAVRPGFRLTPDTAGVVAEICRRLDGLPLALELAAARIASMPARDLLARLDDRFRLLDRDTAGRRSLAATITWSQDLLPEPERRFVTRLAVFPSSFEVDAAGAVAGDGDASLLVSRIVDVHLLDVDDRNGDRWRYRQSETAREYARAGLPPTELLALRERHARHYLDRVRRAAPHLYRAGAGRWLDELHEERENLRAALEWAAGPGGDTEVLIGLAGELWHYWDVRGSRSDGIRWLTAGLAMLGPEHAERMAFLSASALLHLGRAEFDDTDVAAREQLALARRSGDRRWEGDALAIHATVDWARSRFARARQRYEDAVAASLEGDDVWRGAMAEAQLARLHRDRGEPDAARVLAGRATAHADDVGEDLARGLARDVLASIENRWGSRATARDLVERALTHYRLVGYREGEASALHLSGRIAADDGDVDRARGDLARSLEIHRLIGHQAGVVEVLEALAALAGDPREADRLRGDAAEVRALIGV